MAKEGYEAESLDSALHNYVGGEHSPFTLERIEKLIEEALLR